VAGILEKKTLKRAYGLMQVAKAARNVRRSENADREIAKRALVNLLSNSRGIPMKIGQFLSDGSEGDAFSALVHGIDPMPLCDMVPTLEESLGCSWEDVFQDVEESTAAASLGQVHRATLLDGTVTAVKIRYPDIVDAVRAELKLAGLLPGMGPARRWGFDVDSYKKALNDNMDRELDYAFEAEEQERFRTGMTIPGLNVPTVNRSLSTSSVLVQSFESGVRLGHASEWSIEERRSVATTLIKTFFTSLFVTGHVHCDPHEGNMLIKRNPSKSPEVVLLDFGCMVRIDDSERLALLKMILGCMEKDDTNLLSCFSEVGFDVEKLDSIADTLPALCRVIFEPFLNDGPFSTKMWNLNMRTEQLLGESKWWFRSAGPASLFLLMRAFSGLVSHLETLKITVSWKDALREVVTPNLAEEARSYVPSRVSLSSLRVIPNFESIATHLKVLVTEGKKQIVHVTMPAGQVSVLPEIVPEDVAEKIETSGIDLKSLSEETCRNGIVPGELFSLDVSDRQYRVWLE